MTLKYMPIGIAMNGRRCLVVGGSAVALRKVEYLLDYGADVTVVAPRIHDALRHHAQRGRIKVERREYLARDVEGCTVVVAATGEGELNRRIHDDASARGILVNAVDDPPRCDFIVPAVLRRDCLSVAISTDGNAPFMSGHLRAILNDVFPEHWGRLMKLATEFRLRVRERWPDDPAKRRVCFAAFVEADWKQMLEMEDAGIEETLSRIVEHPVCEATP